MTREVVHYKFCSLPFGQYCQISKEDTPQNSLVARTQGAIAVGLSVCVCFDLRLLGQCSNTLSYRSSGSYPTMTL